MSCYSLIVEPGTPLAAERPVLPDDDTYCEMYDYTIGFLASMGYEQYEISNFAQAGYRCRHNMKYWTRAPYIGFGCGASSLYNNIRWDNTRAVEAYIRKNEPVVTAVPEEEQMREFIVLGLRLTEGFSLEEFRQNFGVGFESRYGQTVRQVCKRRADGAWTALPADARRPEGFQCHYVRIYVGLKFDNGRMFYEYTAFAVCGGG